MPDNEPPDNEPPRIGPYPVEVPPPSPNGSRVDRASPVAMLRRAAPGIVVGLVLSLTTVPIRALLHTADFSLWWRIAIAAGLGGFAGGLAQRHSPRLGSATGAAVATAGLLLSYAVVPEHFRIAEGALEVLADVGRLAAWGVVVGGVGGTLGWSARAFGARRSSSGEGLARWTRRSR